MLAGNSSFTTAPPPLPAVVAPGHREGHMGSQSLFVQSDISSGVDFPLQPLVSVTLLTSTVPSLGLGPTLWPSGLSLSHLTTSLSLLVLGPTFTTSLSAPRRTTSLLG